MAKKGVSFAALAAALAAGTAVFAVGDRIYKETVVPGTEPDHSELITKGRLFVREHSRHQDIYLESIDLLKLHAVYIGSAAGDKEHRFAVLVHGINDSGESMGIFAEHYEKQGMNVLMPDLRGFGKSEGDYVGFGFDERMDIIEWIYWILKRDPKARIFLHGVSMGAATVLMTAGEHLPPCVKAVIADSSYSDLKTEFAHVYSERPRSVLPFPWAYKLLRAQTRMRAGFDMDEVSPVKAVARAKMPILFMHGDADRLIPVSMANELNDAAVCEGKRLVTFMGADHIRGVETDPEKYWREADDFLKEAGI